MKILMINQPMSNRGDESAHKAFVRRLLNSFPNVHLTVVRMGMNPDTVQQFSVESNRAEYINLPRLKGYLKFAKLGLQKGLFFLWLFHPTHRKIQQLIKQSDLVISAPGGICLGGFQNWEHLFLLKMVQRQKKKMVYYGRSFGPFPEETKLNRIFKKHSIDALRYMSFLSIRDKKTESLAQSLNLSYVSTVDSAFLESPRVDVPDEIEKTISGNSYVVFVPNLLIWHYAFRNRMTLDEVLSFYKEILSEMKAYYPGRKVVMLPQTFNQGSYNGDDIHFFNDFAKYVHDDSVVVIPDRYSSDVQQTIISKADLVVGARYHSVIFAINNNVPFVALSYEHKISGILETLGKTDCMVDISGTSLFDDDGRKGCIDKFKEILPLVKRDPTAQNKARLIAQNCFEQFEKFLKK